ncbi:MAG: hypothetical protein ACRD2E_04490 [Terriglobales bacterium]
MRDAEFDELVNMLLEKTSQRRLAWTETADRDAFVCTLGGFTFDLRRLEADERTVLQLAIKEGSGHLLWEVRARSAVSSVRPAAPDNLHRHLCDLLELARTQALGLDAKLALLKETLGNA